MAQASRSLRRSRQAEALPACNEYVLRVRQRLLQPVQFIRGLVTIGNMTPTFP